MKGTDEQWQLAGRNKPQTQTTNRATGFPQLPRGPNSKKGKQIGRFF
jgi:hypothetical protein